MNKTITASWKDPNFDIINELSFETRVLYVKNISHLTTVESLKNMFCQYGKVLRIKKYAYKAFIEFETIESAKQAYENLNEKRVDGLLLKIHPARRYDAEKERDLPDRNICFSKNFLSSTDQQVLLKFAFDGEAPQIEESIAKKCQDIIENVKQAQKTQVDNLQQQLDSFKAMHKNSGGGSDNPMNMMFMMMMKNMTMGNMGGNMMNPMMGGMMGQNNQNMNPNMQVGQQQTKVEVKSEGVGGPAQQGNGGVNGNNGGNMGGGNMNGMNNMGGGNNNGNGMGGRMGMNGMGMGGMNQMMNMMNMMNMMGMGNNMGGGMG